MPTLPDVSDTLTAIGLWFNPFFSNYWPWIMIVLGILLAPRLVNFLMYEIYMAVRKLTDLHPSIHYRHLQEDQNQLLIDNARQIRRNYGMISRGRGYSIYD